MTCTKCSVLRTRYAERGEQYLALRLSTVLTRYRKHHGGGNVVNAGTRGGGRSSDV